MTLNEIYERIPAFKCVSGCSACCGIVPIAPAEIENIASYIAMNGVQVRVLGTDLLTCPYVVNERCSIHSVRPALCRIFGVTNDKYMRCPNGGKAARIMPKGEADEILASVFQAGLKEEARR